MEFIGLLLYVKLYCLYFLEVSTLVDSVLHSEEVQYASCLRMIQVPDILP